MPRKSPLAIIFIFLIIMLAAAAVAAPKKKPARTLAWYSAHYKAHNDLASLRVVSRHIKRGWNLRQAQALLGEGVDMGYGGYRYSAHNTYMTLELSIKPMANGKDTIITDKALEIMME